MLIMGPQKIGKTDNLMALPNNLLIDLEDRSDQFTGMAINIKREVEKHNLKKGPDDPIMTPLKLYLSYAKLIQETNQKSSRFVYDFITLDTLTELEQWAKDLALMNYHRSVNADKRVRDVVNELGYGKGYDYLRVATMSLINKYSLLAGKCFIMVAHTKPATMGKEESEMKFNDLVLTGSTFKRLITTKVDAIGIMFRHPDDPNKNILSFKASDTNPFLGASASHLNNNRFLISENKDGKIITYWDKIFNV